MSQFAWDPAKQQYMKYDHQAGQWVYTDNPPEQPRADTRSSRKHDKKKPRTSFSQNAASTARHAQGQSEYPFGSSPPQSGYTHDPVDQLSNAFSGAHIQDDEAPPQYGTLIRGPKESITDAELYKKGVESHAYIEGTPGDHEVLQPEFIRQRNPRIFFVPGKVFRILWPEHPGDNTGKMTVITDVGGIRNTEMIAKFRWFVVVKPGNNFCSCLPISTYGGRGCAKYSLIKWQHGIAYTGKNEPLPFQEEEPREGDEGMLPAIRVVAKTKGEKMERASRIDYGRMYTVEHYVKCKEFGDVHGKYLKKLQKQWLHIVKKTLEVQEESEEEEFVHSEEEEEEVEAEERSQPQSGYLKWVTASYPFQGENMMSIEAGDRIGVLEYTTDDWWKGMNLRTDEKNLFPSSYVHDDPAPSTWSPADDG